MELGMSAGIDPARWGQRARRRPQPGHWHKPGSDATNHKAEQAIRPAVVNRKVWGGNRTAAGAAAQSILMSVLVTLRQNGQDALTFLSCQLRSSQLIALPIPAA